MARPFRIGATGVGVVRATRTNHPNSETGRAVFQCAGWKVSVDDVSQRHGAPSQAEPASTPEAIWDQQSSGGSLREVSMFGGIPPAPRLGE